VQDRQRVWLFGTLLAHPGGILIGQSTYDAVRGEVEAEPFGDLDLKGKPAPIATY
jgi:class 3 adenylate cyclase